RTRSRKTSLIAGMSSSRVTGRSSQYTSSARAQRILRLSSGSATSILRSAPWATGSLNSGRLATSILANNGPPLPSFDQFEFSRQHPAQGFRIQPVFDGKAELLDLLGASAT